MKIRPEKKFQACTGFEPMTSAIPVQRYRRGFFIKKNDYYRIKMGRVISAFVRFGFIVNVDLELLSLS